MHERAGLLQLPEQRAYPGTNGGAPTRTASSGNDAHDTSRTGLGLRSQKALGVGARLQDTLPVKIERGIRSPVGPVLHVPILPSRRTRVQLRWVFLLFVGLLSCSNPKGPIQIGLAGSLSDPVGVPMKQAAELAVAEINASGGVGGRPLELVERDDYSDPDSAVFVATDLYEAGVSAVIGHLFSSTTLAAAPVYNGGSDPVAAISPSSSSPDVSSAGEYTFRVCPSDLSHGLALARWARDTLHFNRGAVLYLNDQYGRGVRQTFAREFIKRGGALVSSDPYLGDSPEVAPYLDRLAAIGGVDFLMVAGNRGEAEEILRQARRRGLHMPVMGGDGLEGIEASGALAEGVYLSAAYLPTIGTQANRTFLQAYRKKFPGAGLPNQPAAATYDAVYLLRNVIARVGTKRKAVRNALARVGRDEPPFRGVTGTVAFDSKGDVPNQAVYIGVVHQGTVRLAGGQ
jgi:branched-chain amino acid transport system substrate-binding protein